MTLPASIALWPDEQRYAFQEKWNIREFDGGQPTEEARAKAEVRDSVAGQQQSLELR